MPRILPLVVVCFMYISIVADIVLFNSHFNLTSFLDSIQAFFKLQPDFRPKGLKEAIMPKSRVLYYPIHIPEVQFNKECAIREMIDHTRLHILWPHRWYKYIFLQLLNA